MNKLKYNSYYSKQLICPFLKLINLIVISHHKLQKRITAVMKMQTWMTAVYAKVQPLTYTITVLTNVKKYEEHCSIQKYLWVKVTAS